MIKIEHIYKSFGKVRVLEDVQASFDAGQSVAILGPNASGKTTLIKCILDMVRPSSGGIFVNGKNIREGRDYLCHIGYMPQIGRYPDHMRVGQVFELMKSLRKKIDQPILDEELIELFELPAIWQKSMYTLSGGTRQKVSAALAFLFAPRVLILDEPMAGLDLVARMQLQQKIKDAQAEGKLILISSHMLDDLTHIVSHLLYLKEGKQEFFHSSKELMDITSTSHLPTAILSRLNQQQSSWEKSSNMSYTTS